MKKSTANWLVLTAVIAALYGGALLYAQIAYPGFQMFGVYNGLPRALAVDASGNLAISATLSGADGAVQDGANSAIEATVKDYANANPLAVSIMDATGDIITSFGGGTQYTEGDTDASITGTALLLEGAANALVAASGTAADGLLVNLGTNNDVTVTGTVDLGATDNAVLDSIADGIAVTNAGTFAAQITGDALTALQLLDNAAGQTPGDNFANPTGALVVYALTGCWDGATWDRCTGSSADTELPAAAALGDDTANPTVPAVAAYMMAFDGSTWDRARLASDMTVGTAFGTGGPGQLAMYSNFDGAALPTATNVDTEGEAVPMAASIQGVQYVMLTGEDGSLQYGTSTTPLVVDISAADTLATVTTVSTVTTLSQLGGIALPIEDEDETGGGVGIYAMGVSRDTLADSGATTGQNTMASYAGTGAMWTAPSAVTNGGCTPNSIISGASVNETEIKASPGQLYTLIASNHNASARYLKIYNDTAANIDETDTPLWRFTIPPSVSGFVIPIPVGVAFSTAITFRMTTGIADNDTGVVSASEHLVSWCFI